MMFSSNSNQQFIFQSAKEVSDFATNLVTKGILALFFLAIFSITKSWVNGVTHQNIFLLVGALLSGATLANYLIIVVRDAVVGSVQKSYVSMLVMLSGFFPYLFGAYLCFYEGLWNMIQLFQDFSVVAFLISIIYIIAGYLIVLSIYEISEFGRAVDKGQVIVSSK